MRLPVAVLLSTSRIDIQTKGSRNCWKFTEKHRNIDQ